MVSAFTATHQAVEAGRRPLLDEGGPSGMNRLEPSLALVALLLAGSAAACQGKTEPPSEPPPSGGLAGSPPVALYPPGTPGPDAVGPPVVADVAAPPEPDAVAPPPEPPDAASVPPPSPDAVVDAASFAAPPDVLPEATRRDTATREVVSAPDVAREVVSTPDVAREVVSAPDVAREVASPDDAGRLPEATVSETVAAPEAGTSGPDPQAAARTFAGAQNNVQRCAEAEGRGELRVRARVRGSDGRVREVTIESRYTDAAEQCARNLIATLRFPTFAGESATLEYTYVIADLPTTTDLGPGATLAQQLEAEESRLRRLAKRCIVGVTGAVTVHVWVSAETRTATLRRVDGDVTAEQRECLSEVARSANLPNLPSSAERSWRIQ